MFKFIIALALLAPPVHAASLDDLPVARERGIVASAAPRAPTMWKIRIEGERGDWLIPIRIAKGFRLRPGQTVSIDMARLIAEKMGAHYPDDIRENLERLDKLR
jgi:hypothetical protein